VDARVEMPVESQGPRPPGAGARLQLRLLGPMQLHREGVPVALPASRKVRALLAYLALSPRPVPRSTLCELLWDVPNDPRGELRWCLSKIRRALDDAGIARIASQDDMVRLDLAGVDVDALAIARATESGTDALPTPTLQALASNFAGDLLQGLELERNPVFAGWLTAQRRRFRGAHAALLEALASRLPDGDALPVLERWLALSPFDPRAHGRLLAALARSGRVREGEEHLASALRQFEAEGLDCAALHHAWRSVRAARADAPAAIHVIAPAAPAAAARRASVAVMPFADAAALADAGGSVGDALAHDVITRLAKLRSLFVIAQGTVFALHARRVDAGEAARMLDVDYVVCGTVRVRDTRLVVAVELAETRTARIVWAESFDHPQADAFAVLDAIGNRIVASIASEIELLERNRAVLKPPNSLDAWEAYHRGLWHMYRFTREDNAQAQQFFDRAVRLDPTFARAHAGLSYAHWQNAFQGWADREASTASAYEIAGRGLLADDRDPAAHWAMGRALWLRGRHDDAVGALHQAVALSPNFAMGHYTLSFVQSQAGDPQAAIAASDHSRHLSPFDPLLFGMFGARAMALVRLGRYDEAAQAAQKAAARPNAHPHIFAIAAYSCALAGDLEAAQAHAAVIRRHLPRYSVADYLQAFRFDADGEARFREGARAVGMG
jgi:DNA-binding SARP family transcriptional activator